MMMHSTNLFAKAASNESKLSFFIYLLIYKNKKLIVLNEQLNRA